VDAKHALATRERYELAGDGALVTAGTLSALTGIVLLITGVIIQGSVPVWIELASSAAVLVGSVAGPVIAWLLHGRRITVPAAVGALLGLPVTGIVFFGFVAFSTALGWALKGLNDADWFGPLVAAGLVSVAAIGGVAWLVADGIRDRAPSRREHLRVDRARFAAAAAVVAYSTVVIMYALRPGSGEVLEAIAFVLLGAVGGASIVGMADALERILTADGGRAVGSSADAVSQAPEAGR
jgi:hypothetical protein